MSRPPLLLATVFALVLQPLVMATIPSPIPGEPQSSDDTMVFQIGKKGIM
ncbi:MAG: hypothetical protein M2R45_04635 [Verrucomicrobia subdivision 3 bacterium]|nr:hypothetical protein [Limisphaerales bacterium]